MEFDDWSMRVAAYYDRLVDRYGHDPRSCDYGNTTSQLTKFRVLAEAMDLRGKRVLDVGCGFADFARYLSQLYGDLEYVGIDISPRMIEEARRIHPMLDLRRANVLDGGLEGDFDFVTANGIFYLLDEPEFQRMQLLIRRMFDLAIKAVAFTSLSTWAPTKEPGEFQADPIETLAFCRTLTPWVVLRHDYLPHDFAIYMYKEARRV